MICTKSVISSKQQGHTQSKVLFRMNMLVLNLLIDLFSLLNMIGNWKNIINVKNVKIVLWGGHVLESVLQYLHKNAYIMSGKSAQNSLRTATIIMEQRCRVKSPISISLPAPLLRKRGPKPNPNQNESKFNKKTLKTILPSPIWWVTRHRWNKPIEFLRNKKPSAELTTLKPSLMTTASP